MAAELQLELHLACRQDRLGDVANLIANNLVDINSLDISGKTPLAEAIYWKCSEEIISVLIQSGADLNRCNTSESALILACRIGNYKAAHICIDYGCDVNLRTLDAKHETALHILLRKFHTLIQVGHSAKAEHYHAFSEQLLKVTSLCERISKCKCLHLDIPDVYGKTVADLMQKPGFLGKIANDEDEEKFRTLLLYPRLPPPLSCLAAQQCARNYYNCFLLPSKMQEFVTLHLKPSDVARYMSIGKLENRGRKSNNAQKVRVFIMDKLQKVARVMGRR